MEDSNLALLWKEHQKKIDQTLFINKQILNAVVRHNSEIALRSLVRFKTKGVISVVVYLALLGLLLFYAITHYSSSANYFIASFTVIFLINVKALCDYIKHSIWLKNIDYDNNITETQQRLNRLQLSIFQHTRFMFLQLPFWTTFYLSNKWFPHSVSLGYIIFQILFTGIFLYLSYFIYRNLTIQNANKNWVKIIINASGGKYVRKALDFYDEIEQFRAE